VGKKIMPGGEPFFYEAGKVGCLLIHGFTGTASSMKPMGEALARKGITTLGVRLEGHGTSVEDMQKSTYPDWIASAEKGLSELQDHCDYIYVSGLSMGGALSLYLASVFPREVLGVIPICAPVFMKEFKIKLVPILKHVIKTVPAIGGNLKDPEAVEITYDRTPVAATHELIKLLKIVNNNLASIKQPALIFAAVEDGVVSPDNAPHIYKHISSAKKELVWLKNSYHVATLDYDKEIIFNKTAEFINNNQKEIG